MELHPENRLPSVLKAHDQSLFGPRSDFQLGELFIDLDLQGVIPDRGEWVREAIEYVIEFRLIFLVGVEYQGGPSMERFVCRDNLRVNFNNSGKWGIITIAPKQRPIP